MYRQIKKFDSSTNTFQTSGSLTYGDGQTVFVVDITVTVGSGGTTPQPGQPSTDATLKDLKVDGTSVAGFAPTTYLYTVTLPAGTTTAPQVSGTVNESHATTDVTQAATLQDTAKIEVTAQDGTTKLTYQVAFTVQQSGGTDPVTPVTPSTPTQTTLSLHETEIYEAAKPQGYGGTLTVFNNREYEVYYINRDANSKFSVNTTNVDKTGFITTTISDTACVASDGWFTIDISGTGGDTGFSAKDEFLQSLRKANMNAGDSLVLHVKGYSEFAIAAVDKKSDASDPRHFDVFVDGIKQASQISTEKTVRRYALTPNDRHVIKVAGGGKDNSQLYAFSLQVAYIPKVKFVSGNDSTQVVYQTANIQPIKYFIKNKLGDVVIDWHGHEATGIALQANAAGDTVTLQGTANCAVGTYNYTVQAKDNAGNVISSMNGSFTVDHKVECLTPGRLKNYTVYEKTAISPVEFRCYVLSMGDVSPRWLSGEPAGLRFNSDPDKHLISLTGTPTVPGTYDYAVILGQDSILGNIIVESNSPTVVPGASKTLLYLYKNDRESGVFNYLKTKYNYFRRAAAQLSAAAEYAQFDAIVIAEDVDATNEEVLGLIRATDVQKPVLNMKIFTYSANRLGWGEPNNGSVSNTKMTIMQPRHPIFSGLTNQAEVELLSAVAGNKGLMPADMNCPGTVCLAIAPTRDTEDYEAAGPKQTFIHEVPATMRGGAKYLTLPIGSASTANMTTEAKALFDNMINYLTSNATTDVSAPIIEISAFSINGVAGKIDQKAKTIEVTLPRNTDVTALKPVVTLVEDKLTYVTPASGEEVDFSDTHYGVIYTVSDYITKVKYTVKVKVPTDLESADSDGLWFSEGTLHNNNGVWVNIYSVSGQLMTTTNSDFSFSSLPRGLYVVRSNNAVLKVMH